MRKGPKGRYKEKKKAAAFLSGEDGAQRLFAGNFSRIEILFLQFVAGVQEGSVIQKAFLSGARQRTKEFVELLRLLFKINVGVVQQIIRRNMEIIGEFDQDALIPREMFAALIKADHAGGIRK